MSIREEIDKLPRTDRPTMFVNCLGIIGPDKAEIIDHIMSQDVVDVDVTLVELAMRKLCNVDDD